MTPYNIKAYRNLHPGGRVFITASGPSLLEFDPELLRKEQIITVNETITRFPWAQYSVALDHKPYAICTKYDNILFTTRKDAYPNVKIGTNGTQPFSFDLTGGVYVGFTTTFVALQLAVWLGFKDIYICGLDLGITKTHTHFYGYKPFFDTETGINFKGMRGAFNAAAPLLSDWNVVNCSMDSQLSCFPKQSIEEILRLGLSKLKPETLQPVPEYHVKPLTLHDNLKLVGSKFQIVLDSGEILPGRYSMKEHATKAIEAVNEHIRRKGGRPPKVVIEPERKAVVPNKAVPRIKKDK
jgi:hypothetical protein